jgi:prevent-host-death family protein
MSIQVNVLEAKTQLSRLLDRAEAGEDVIIARAGHPVARLVPITAGVLAAPRVLGTLEGRGWIADDLDAPLDADFLLSPGADSPREG